jgi:TrmH family RNA methyltransferase
MLTREQRERIVVVLVRARNPNNIGAVARAMHDFGFSMLRVVNEYVVPFETARSAVDAGAVLGAAVAYESIAAAVADCALVVGTTAVGERDLQHPLRVLADGAELIRQIDGVDAGRVALLFGSEKTGLSNEELSHCNWLMTIPMEEHAEVRHPSMNLGQAVAVCLYELVRGSELPVGIVSEERVAGAAELERLTVVMMEVLERTGYMRHHPANSDEAQIRRLVVRMGVSANDAQVWMGVLRQVLWKLRSGDDGSR